MTTTTKRYEVKIEWGEDYQFAAIEDQHDADLSVVRNLSSVTKGVFRKSKGEGQHPVPIKGRGVPVPFAWQILPAVSIMDVFSDPSEMLTRVQSNAITVNLKDQGDEVTRFQPVSVNSTESGVTIHAHGYSDANNEDGCIVLLEQYEGELKLRVYSDINRDDPTHVIQLGDAKSSNRRLTPEEHFNGATRFVVRGVGSHFKAGNIVKYHPKHNDGDGKWCFVDVTNAKRFDWLSVSQLVPVHPDFEVK